MSDFLNAITVASPCTADWNAMQGDDQVRFCQQCQLNVYNLSGMTQTAAETLILSQEGRLCVRFYQRPDGTLITQDCPVGMQALHHKRLPKPLKARWGKLAAAMTLLTLAGTFQLTVSAQAAQATQASTPEPTNGAGQSVPFFRPLMGKPMMGDVANPTPPSIQPRPEPGQTIQGNMAMPAQAATRPLSPKKACKHPQAPAKKVSKQQQVTPTKPHDLSELQPIQPMMGAIAPQRFLQNQPELVPVDKPILTPQSDPPATPEKPMGQ